MRKISVTPHIAQCDNTTTRSFGMVIATKLAVTEGNRLSVTTSASLQRSKTGCARESGITTCPSRPHYGVFHKACKRNGLATPFSVALTYGTVLSSDFHNPYSGRRSKKEV